MKKVTPHLLASFVTLAILGSSYFYFNAGSSCTYRIRGNLKVRTQLGAEISPSFENTVLPLKGVKVRVKGRSSTALPWTNWGEVQTDENGYFNITRQKSGSACSYGRHIKVDAKFVSNRMEIARGGLVDEWGTFPDWYRVGERTRQQCKGTSACDFGDLTFKQNANYDRSDEKARKHADIWYYYTWALDHMRDLGLPINRNSSDILRVVYPLNRYVVGSSEASYVSPGSKIIHIFANRNRDHFNLETIWHELAHVWAFRYTTGEEVMRNYLLANWSTHGVVKKPQVAFHEGFADWFMYHLKNRFRSEKNYLTGTPIVILKDNLRETFNIQSNSYSKCEHSRRKKKREDDKGRLECLDFGWLNILSTLTFDDLYYPDTVNENNVYLFDFNYHEYCEPYDESVCPAYKTISSTYKDDLNCSDFPIRLTFKELLQTVQGKDDDDFTLNTFMNSVKNRFSISNTDIDILKEGVDPTNLDNFNKYYCSDGIFLEDFAFGSGPGYEFNWTDTGSSFRKNEDVKFNVINKGSQNSVPNSYVITPFSLLASTTPSAHYKPKIDITDLTNNDYFSPGQKSLIYQVPEIPKAPNGSFPVVSLGWRTSVEKISKSGGTLVTTQNPDWQTNSIRKTFGSDINVESVVLPIARESDLYNNAKNEIGFSQNIPKSGGSLTYEDNVLRYYFKLFGSDAPVIRHFVNDPPYDPDIIYKEFIGACGAENIGNAPPFYNTKMVINIAGRDISHVTIPNLEVGNGYIYPFKIFVDQNIRRLGPIKLKCLVDPGREDAPYGEVTELNEFNNDDESDFFHTFELDVIRSIDLARIFSQSNFSEFLVNSTSYDNPVYAIRAIKAQREKINDAATAYELKYKTKNRNRLLDRFIKRSFVRRFTTPANVQRTNRALTDNILTRLNP